MKKTLEFYRQFLCELYYDEFLEDISIVIASYTMTEIEQLDLIIQSFEE